MSVITLINKLLPFATPGTPLLQDLVHLASICTLLYFAPQIQAWLQARREVHGAGGGDGDEVAGGLRQSQQPQEPQEVGHDRTGEADGALPNLNPDPQIQQDNHNAPQDQDQDHDNNVDPQLDIPAEGQPGPANAQPIRDLPPQRAVGAKKAKALARKDQRRAYHEFQRSQGEAQRARDAEGAAEREAALAAERARRRAVEEAILAEKAREREGKREAERREREREARRTERVLEVVRAELGGRGRMCDLDAVARRVGAEEEGGDGDVDPEWVERVVRNAPGLCGMRDGELTMVTGTGWVVRVDAADMRRFYEVVAPLAKEKGQEGLRFEELGPHLESVLRETRSTA